MYLTLNNNLNTLCNQQVIKLDLVQLASCKNKNVEKLVRLQLVTLKIFSTCMHILIGELTLKQLQCF